MAEQSWPRGAPKPEPDDVVQVLMSEAMARRFEERCLNETELGGPLLFREDDLPTYIISPKRTDTEIRNRDKWRCTAMRLLVLPRQGVRTPRRCSVMGSEMLVRDGRTLCPSCAQRLEAGETEPLVSPRPRARN